MTKVEVPASDAPIIDIWHFAITYFGYDRHGGTGRLARFANDALGRWKATGEFPSSTPHLRAALFFEARRWHHFGYDPDAESEEYVRGLVDRIAASSGGSVDQDRNSPIIVARRFANRIRRRL